MYEPDEPDFAARFVLDHPLGLLMTEGRLHAAHVPMLPVAGEGQGGIDYLIGHVTVADPIARELSLASARALAVFTGPSAYITPEWYRDPGLPTYNFGAVHVTGAARLLTVEALREHLIDLVAVHEASQVHRPHAPWTMDEAAHARMEALLPLVVGFVIEPERVEAKLKVGQNRRAAEIVETADHLAASGDSRDVDVAGDMRRVARERLRREQER